MYMCGVVGNYFINICVSLVYGLSIYYNYNNNNNNKNKNNLH